MVDPDWEYVEVLKRLSRGEAGPIPPTFYAVAPRIEKRVGMLTGSHFMQTYWVASKHGNMQFSLPFTYVFEMNRWVPRNDVFLIDPARPWVPDVWNVNCILCHATAGQPRQDAKTAVIDSRAAELGIACEACHGPAAEHVRANSEPTRRYALHYSKRPDPTIFNPARADHIKSSETCGQCHAIRIKARLAEWQQHGLPFRPGGDIESCAPLNRFDAAALNAAVGDARRRTMEGSFWSDGMVRVSGREFSGMAGSACYKKGGLSCLSCHSMHQYVSNDNQLASRGNGNEACLQCHSAIGTRLETHTRHRAASSGSLCYNCHMPHTTYGLLKAIRSHWIDSPSVQSSLDIGRPNACNLCHLDRSLGWTARYLKDWFGTPPPALSPEQEGTSAAVTWILAGDAGQRALLAWHFGWEPALQTSGRDWAAPYLAELLQDPYSVVRHISNRSLQRSPGFENFSYDYIGPMPERAWARERALGIWRAQIHSNAVARPALFLDASGALQQEKFSALLRRRDNRSLELLE
jgi:predicted CXXCH cytochrome family protein